MIPDNAYFKVLRRNAAGKLVALGKGGALAIEYPEPSAAGAGEWLALPDGVSPVLCSRGFHLTQDPAYWFETADCEVYLVEHDGAVDGPRSEEEPTKIAVARTRLVRRLTVDELAALRIFVSGSHEVRTKDNQVVRASDSAKVTAYGSAKVTAYGSANVTAYDSANVTASGSANVTAKDRVVATLNWRAQAALWNDATGIAFDESVVKLHDSARCVDRRAAGKVRTLKPRTAPRKSKSLAKGAAA